MQLEGKKLYIDKATLKEMLRREHYLRTCEETQAKYAQAEGREDTDWMEVTIGLQEQVIQEFKIKDMKLGLYYLRRACDFYPDDPDFLTIPLYHKYQRSRQGDLRVGDKCPSVLLHLLNGQSTDLLDLCQPNMPTCIFAGSYT